MRCSSKTKLGKRCKRKAKKGRKSCGGHRGIRRLKGRKAKKLRRNKTNRRRASRKKKRRNPRVPFPKTGGSGLGKFKVGKKITDIKKLKVGDLLVKESKQFNATNIVKITKVETQLAYGRFVSPDDPSKPRLSGDRRFVIWGFDLEDGEYSFAKVRNSSGRCSSKTKLGKRCKRKAKRGRKSCGGHRRSLKRKTRKARRF